MLSGKDKSVSGGGGGGGGTTGGGSAAAAATPKGGGGLVEALAAKAASEAKAGGGGGEAKNSAAFLANAAINLVSLREFYRAELVKVLTSVKGRKTLVLDRKLAGPLGLVAEVDLLKKYGVDSITYLLPEELRTNSPNVLYLIRPDVRLMQMIADQVLHIQQSESGAGGSGGGAKRTFSAFFVPRRTMLCERVLQEQGVYGDIRTGEYPLELIPFDEDVLSLEMSNAFSDCFLAGDPSTLFYVARSIIKLQSIFGIIPNVKGKGDMAYRVLNLIQRMRRESPKDMFNSLVPEIDTLIIVDRAADLVTPMLTQMTYEGLIDEHFGIANSIIEIEPELVGGKSTDKKKLKHSLNSNDSLYKEIRDVNFRVLGPLLHKKAEFVADTYNKRHDAKTVTQMASFMKEFKTAHNEHTQLQAHINIAERISQWTKSNIFERHIDMEQMLVDAGETRVAEDYLEALICKQDDLSKVLRFACLMSLTKGVERKRFDFLKRELIQTYGFEKMFTLNNLERAGLFAPLTRKNNWPTLRKAFRLLEEKDKIDLKTPNDINYTYSGYAPLSIRLIELAAKPGGWKRAEELLGLIPGKTFEVTQELPSAVQERAKVATGNAAGAGAGAGTVTGAAAGAPAAPSTAAVGKDGKPIAGGAPAAVPSDSKMAALPAAGGEKRKPLTLVFFIGGVTFGRDYIIASTKLVNGKTLLESVTETVWNRLRPGAAKQYAGAAAGGGADSAAAGGAPRRG